MSALPILLALVPYLMLSSAMPTTCANYQYAKLFSRPLAVAAWMALFVAIPIGMLPLFAIATAQLLGALIPELPTTITAIVVMSLFYAINVIGIRAAAYTQLAAVAVLLAALGVFIAMGIPEVSAARFAPLFPGGAFGIVAASALLYTLLAGGLFGIEMGDEVRDARAVIPKALMISVGVVLVIYLLIEIVAVGVMDWSIFAGGSLDDVAGVFLHGAWLTFFVVGGGITASVTTINLALTAGGRYALAFARDGYFPSFFGAINRRFGTPHYGLTLMYLMAVVTLCVNPPLQLLGAMLNFGLLFMITLVLCTALTLPKRHPEVYRRSQFQFSRKVLAVMCLTAVSMNVVFMILLAAALRWTFLIFVGAAVAGFILFYVAGKRPAA
jgi:APA family basic amino acid/polyamine antiporter